MTDVAIAPAWVCVACRATVDMTEDVCTSCGRPFAEGLWVDSPASGRSPAWLVVVRELVVLNVLFIIWRIVGSVSVFHEAGAFARGRWIWGFERTLHLPSEATLQHPVLGHVSLSKICNGYYAYAHAPLLAATLLWLLWRHREMYAGLRNLVVATTGVSLLLGFIPVAPPRLVGATHMVDLASRYHQSVYSSLGTGISDQLSALPSVHIVWAVLVAGAVIAASRSRWRWAAVAHPVVTAYVVVVTANHYWLDVVAALVVVAAVYSVLHRYRPSLLA